MHRPLSTTFLSYQRPTSMAVPKLTLQLFFTVFPSNSDGYHEHDNSLGSRGSQWCSKLAQPGSERQEIIFVLHAAKTQ